MIARKAGGFSLIELMVVITIIAMLASGVAIALFQAVHEAKSATARSDMADIEKAAGLFRLQQGRYPDSLSELSKPIRGYPDGVVPNGIKPDPWGREYRYERIDKGFSLISLGEDGVEGGEGPAEDIELRGR